MDSDNFLQRIREYLILVLAFNTARDELVWKYIVAVAAQLEHLAVTVLWINRGRQPSFWEYADTLTLGQAANQIEGKSLLTPETHKILKSVARLRNSVVHKRIMQGVTEVAEYKGQKLFQDNSALEQLVTDADWAIEELKTWFKQHCPDLLSGES